MHSAERTARPHCHTNPFKTLLFFSPGYPRVAPRPHRISFGIQVDLVYGEVDLVYGQVNLAYGQVDLVYGRGVRRPQAGRVQIEGLQTFVPEFEVRLWPWDN